MHPRLNIFERFDLEQICRWLLFAMMAFFILGRGVAEVTLAIIASIFLIRNLVSRNTSWLDSPLILYGLILWLYLLVHSWLIAHIPEEAMQRSLAWPRLLFLVSAMSTWLLLTKEIQAKLGIIIACFLTFVALDVALQGAIGVDILGNEREKLKRLNGPFDDYVAGSYMIKLLFPALAALMIWCKRRPATWKQHLWIAFLITIAGGIILTGERAAMLLLITGLGFFALFLQGKLRRILLASGAVILILAAVIFMTVPGVKQRLAGENTMRHFNNFWDTPYGVIYSNSFEMIKTYPVFGVGMRNYRYVCRRESYDRFKNLSSECGTHPHNTYLELWVETGLVGLLLFLGLFGGILIYTLRMRRYAGFEDKILILGTGTGLFVFLFPFLPTMSFFANWNAILFWFVLGWHISILERQRKEKHGPWCG